MKPQGPADDSAQGRLRLAGLAAVVVAVAARVLFLGDKPFWRDEAWVALLVDDPVAGAQAGGAAPLGYLWLVKATALLLPGPPEVSLRLVSLAGGIAAVPLLGRLAISAGGDRRTAVAAMWLAAGLQPLVHYSRELKSYGLDFLLAVLAPLTGFTAFAAQASASWATAAFLVTAAAGPWLSFGGVFAIAAVVAWGWLAGWWKRSVATWLACSAVFAASLAALWAVALRHQVGNRWMQHYWKGFLASDDTLPLPLRVGACAWEYVFESTTFLFPDLWPAVVVVAAVGAFNWPARGRLFLAAFWAGTAAATAVAAAFDQYLLASGRLLLFAAPVPLLWTAQGLRTLGSHLSPRRPAAIALGIPIALSLWWAGQAVHHRIRPYFTKQEHFYRLDVRHDVSGAVARAVELLPPGDTLLVTRRCSYAFQFYNRGRVRSALYCRSHCDSARHLDKKWLATARPRGWVMLLDEDVRWMRDFLERHRYVYRQGAATDGVRIWQIERSKPGTSPRRRPAPVAPTSRPPTTTWPR